MIYGTFIAYNLSLLMRGRPIAQIALADAPQSGLSIRSMTYDDSKMKIAPILLFLIATLLAACDPEPTPKPPDNHKVISPFVKDLTYSAEYVAEIHAIRHVELRSKVKAYLDKIHVDEGRAVAAGQLLFTLNPQALQKELQKAEAAYKSAIADLRVAEVELRNVQLLADKNIVAQTELDVAKARVAALQADVDETVAGKGHAALLLAFSEIKAPFAGVINRIPNKVGSLIEEAGILTTLSDNSEVLAYFNLSEADYLDNLASGQKHYDKVVGLRLANAAIYDHEGKVDMVASVFDRATGNIAFRAKFPNPDRLLKEGSNGKVLINRQLKQAVLIPQKSTFEVQDKLFVYVVDPQGVLKQRSIVPKMRIPDFFVVEFGLLSTDKILFEGVEGVRDGDKIQPTWVNLVDEMPSVNDL